MMKGLMVDDNMSNLTFASSGEIVSASSSSTRNDQSLGTITMYPQNSFTSTNQELPPPPPPPPNKKKRNLPGNPDPEAEVVALSPKTLLTTNRFICEICNKGFQRDQNLQLHRRGHNLPWKLKQRSNKDVIKKKVYVCPEVTCVHHDPSRALGDLTGIKKHFFRKHGEKKWKCEKCSKRYAVQSDWKAHSKICGTREYRCDCGTLFSRRDSFITHRAFCDALAQESSSTTTTTLMTAVTTNQPPPPLLHHHHHLHRGPAIKTELRHDLIIPPWLPSPPPPQPQQQQQLPPPPPPSSSTAFASATALLQKAAQMGSTMSTTRSSNEAHHHHGGGSGLIMSSKSSGTPAAATAFVKGHNNNEAHHYHGGGGGLIMSSRSSGTPAAAAAFVKGHNNNETHHHHHGGGGGPIMSSRSSGTHDQYLLSSATRDDDDDEEQFIRFGNDYDDMMSSLSAAVAPRPPPANNDGLTRDFLGLRKFSHSDIFNIVGIDQRHHHHINSSSSSSSAYGTTDHHHHHHLHQKNDQPWQG